MIVTAAAAEDGRDLTMKRFRQNCRHLRPACAKQQSSSSINLLNNYMYAIQ